MSLSREPSDDGPSHPGWEVRDRARGTMYPAGGHGLHSGSLFPRHDEIAVTGRAANGPALRKAPPYLHRT